MPSPFPGMDPYLEASWSDVHSTLVPLIRKAVQRQLPQGLRAVEGAEDLAWLHERVAGGRV